MSNLSGYIQHEAAYLVLKERGEPMTAEEIAAEMARREFLFYGSWPANNVHRTMQKRLKGYCTYVDGKWSITKDMVIPPA